MNNKEIAKCLMLIDTKLVMPIKTTNLLPEYSPYFEIISEAIRQLYYKVQNKKDPWQAKDIFETINEKVKSEKDVSDKAMAKK